MKLVLREFHAQRGDGEQLMMDVRVAATRLVREAAAEAVVVCQRADRPEHALWLEHAPSGSRLPEPGAALISCSVAEYAGPPLALQFVDGVYRFPLQGCRVWALETREPKLRRALFGLSRTMQYDRQVCGVSIYRAAHDLSHALVFLALDRDRLPAEFIGHESIGETSNSCGFTCAPLASVWTFGRLTGRADRAPIGRYPRVPFWPQFGMSIIVATESGVGRPAATNARMAKSKTKAAVR